MFNERAQHRLSHPIRTVPELTAADDGIPDVDLANRLAAAYRASAQLGDLGPVWEPLLQGPQARFAAALQSGDHAALAVELAAFGRSEAAQGFFGGAGQHRKCTDDPAFAQLLAVWTYDKLLSLAEAVGAIRVELPETGAWAESPGLPALNLWDRIERHLGIDLSPPDHVGGYLGIAAGDHVIQMRIVEAIYAAYRLKQICEQRGVGRVCEIGAGAGLTAYYAALFGIADYVIIDLPTLNAVQAYLLCGSRIGGSVGLGGEDEAGKTIRILPPDGFAELPQGSIDILYNQDSFPEIDRAAALQYLRTATDLDVPIFLSINQEAHLPAGSNHQLSVPELVAQVGTYRQVSRHRHWLRQGYLEELYEFVR